MKSGRPKKAVILSLEDRALLVSFTRSRTLPHGLARRARIIVLAADGLSNDQIAEKVDISKQSVCLWRQRYLRDGFKGLYDELKPGRPRTLEDEAIAKVVRRTLKTRPKDGTHWTVRSMAEEAKISSTTIYRIWQAF